MEAFELLEGNKGDFPVFTTKSAQNKLQTMNKLQKECRDVMSDRKPGDRGGQPKDAAHGDWVDPSLARQLQKAPPPQRGSHWLGLAGSAR